MNNPSSKTKHNWFYQGTDHNGNLVSGTIDAPTTIIARVRLRKQGIMPLKLTPVKQQNKSNLAINEFNTQQLIHELTTKSLNDNSLKKKIKKPVKNKEITIFIKQFLVALKSGVPLLRAFDIVIEGQKNKKFRAILKAIRFSVENGSSLSESFALYPKVFDSLFINFLTIGEQGGILENLLSRYLEYKEKTDAITRKIKTALAYPLIIVIVSFIVLSIILGFVVPQFQAIFTSMNLGLPLPTLIVIRISHLVINYWWLLVILLVTSFFSGKYLYHKFLRFRFFIDRSIFYIPLVGALNQKALLSRWSRTLALLFAAGIPLNNALRSIAVLVNNYLYGSATLSIEKDIENGSSLYKAMLTTGVFPNMINQMVLVGEEAGSLDSLLQSAADYYEDETRMMIESLLSLIEPATIIILGLILGAIIVAIYLPLFHLGDALN